MVEYTQTAAGSVPVLITCPPCVTQVFCTAAHKQPKIIIMPVPISKQKKNKGYYMNINSQMQLLNMVACN